MDVLSLRPSEIRYSQDSINNVFDAKSTHKNKFIGNTLDDLCTGECSVENIPSISVKRINGKWFSTDNRRLWVFKHLERHGKCKLIPVYETYYIPDRKFSTRNEGESIRVRGDPGGIWYRKPNSNFQENIPTRGTVSKKETMIDNFNPTYSSEFRPGDQCSTAMDKSKANTKSEMLKYYESASQRRYLTEQGNKHENSVPSHTMDRLRIQTPVVYDKTMSERDICEQSDDRQAPKTSVRFQTLRNFFETKMQQENIVPKCVTKNGPECKHSTEKVIQIANTEPTILGMKTAGRSSDSHLVKRTQSERPSILHNRLPSYSNESVPRTQTDVSQNKYSREVKSKKREQEVNKSPRAIGMTRTIDKTEIQTMISTSKPSTSAATEKYSSERHRRDVTTASSLIQPSIDEKPKRILRKLYTLQWLNHYFQKHG
ncbi:hypothetical protein ACJMK2_034257 [Sinanodonta woodiana]|uniref:Uncharacterized protein n=1 Tax=Sinanodonta woodiana TaxID=1069815 RepID=A0ABD3WT58_SINWO